MSVIIFSVVPGSAASKANIIPGEKLLSINSHTIKDVLDYRFYMMESQLKLEIENIKTGIRQMVVRKKEYEDLGLEFETYLMDKQRSCKNKCIFCFIDQMPKGMRKSLYFKDDDARLSFLFGNYITLTNLKDEDVKRIIRMKISPVNVSVHTTNPALRIEMMGNSYAGEQLVIIKRLCDHGISVNCQTVLCPGINDGFELRRTLSDLASWGVENVACVPVGITDYRQGLYELKPYTFEAASKTIDLIDEFSDAYEKEHGFRLAYASDEFYLLADRPIPEASFYGGFNQLDNGVGMLASMRAEFMEALDSLECSRQNVRISIATGVAAYEFMCFLVDELKKKWHNLNCTIFPIINNFFGENITVAGLITGQDILHQLKGKHLGDCLLISSSMLKSDEDVFLDDLTLDEVKRTLSVDIKAVNNDGYDLLEALTMSYKHTI